MRRNAPPAGGFTNHNNLLGQQPGPAGTIDRELAGSEGARALASTRTRKSRSVALRVQGIGVPVELRRHAGARRLTLRVSKTRRAVVVTVPAECRMEEAGRFLRNHIDWVQERLGRVPEPVPFIDGAKVPLRGRLHKVRFTGAARGVGVVNAEDVAGSMPRLAVSGRIEHASRRLMDWLAQEARADLDRRVTWHARRLGVRVKRIGLRDQTTRWGSCSASGLLSFSWRLILAPPFVLDYVAAHEVAHLLEMNHGPRFWKLVAKAVPRLEEAKEWLRNEGSELHRYGVEVMA
jgi:predicted metal-dependent hydrolase